MDGPIFFIPNMLNSHNPNNLHPNTLAVSRLILIQEKFNSTPGIPPRFWRPPNALNLFFHVSALNNVDISA